MSSALDILHRFGIRPSHQRLAVLSHLLQHRDHSSADKIYEELHRDIPMISRTTVYNTLRLFKDAGVIQTLSIGTNPLIFDADTSPHAHLYCHRCHSVSDILVQLSDWQRLSDYGGPHRTHMQVIFDGICDKCSRHS